MASSAQLLIEVLADAKQAEKVLDGLGTAMGGVGESSDKMSAALIAGAASAGAGLLALGVTAFNAFEESAKIGRETVRVLESTGAAAWISADQVSALAQSISDKSGADDEAIQSGANLLLTFTQVQDAVGEGNDIFSQATELSLDMATAMGKDMQGAALQLGKALNDPVKGMQALTRSGVAFTAAQRDQVQALMEVGDLLGAQKVILAEVRKEFGGAAEAAGTPLDKLMVKIGNLQEDLGSKLSPAVQKAAEILGDNLAPAIAKVGEVMSENSGILQLAFAGAAAAVALFAASLAQAAATSIVAFMKEAVLQAQVARIAFTEAAASTGTFGGALAALNFLIGPVGIALAALTAGAFAIIGFFDKSSDSAEKFWATMSKGTDLSNLDSVRSTIDLTREHIEDLSRTAAQAGLGDFAAGIADWLVPFHDVEGSVRDTQNEIDNLSGKTTDLDAAIASNTDKLRLYANAQAGVDESNSTSIASFESLTKHFSDAEVAAGAINGKLLAIAQSKKIDLTDDDAVGRVKALFEATTKTSESTLGMSEAAEKYNDAAATSKDKTDAFKLSLDSLIGIQLSAAQAETSYSKNSVSLLKTLTENRANANGQLKAGTDASLANIVAINNNNSAIQDNVKSALDHANAVFRQTNNLETATGVLNDHRNQLIAVMVQTGYTEEQAKAYVDQLGLTPKNIDTTAHLDKNQASNDASALQGQVDKLGKGVTVPVTLTLIDKIGGSIRAIENMGRSVAVPAGPTVGTTTITTQPINVSVSHAGLGVDSPTLQRQIVAAIRKHEARNGRSVLVS